MHARTILPSILLAVLPAVALAATGTIPDQSYSTALLHEIVSPQMGRVPHNQPHVVDGYLLLAGNGFHTFWDIADPLAPRKLSEMLSPFGDGEAESHTITFARDGGGRLLACTISGRGVDFWDVTDVRSPVRLSSLEIEGIDFGDNTNAVWGVFWQGRHVFVGGTNTGLHVVDATDPSAPAIVAHLPTSELGGVSAGPLFALGNLLVVTTPKDHAGLATLDVGDPTRPRLLDFVVPASNSYMGGFYGRYAHLLTPFRTYDVTTDPAAIRLVGSVPTPNSEYMSFGDGFLFLGALRPNPGVHKIDPSDPTDLRFVARIDGRRIATGLLAQIGNDDQFSVPIGNLLVLSDDEKKLGSVLAVHDTRRDTAPPEVLYVNPVDGAVARPVRTRIGLSFSDQIELASIDASSVILRPLGGDPVPGRWGLQHTLVSFEPDRPLEPGVTYEVVVPAGGVTDLVGNPVAARFRSTFSTGSSVVAPSCAIEVAPPVRVGRTAHLDVEILGSTAGGGTWDYGDGTTSRPGESGAVRHTWDEPGRHRVSYAAGTGASAVRCAAIQIVHPPLAAARPTRSSSVLVDEAGGRVWVVNPDAGTVAAVDASTLAKVLEVPVGLGPRTLARAGDGTIWVANQGSATITVLGPGGAVRATIDLPYGSRPYGIVFDPDGTRGYATLEATGQLLALDPRPRTVVGTLDLGPDDAGLVPAVRGLAVAPDGDRVLVTRFRSPAGVAEVHEVHGPTLTRVATHVLAPDPGPDASDAGRGVPNYASSIAIGPDGTTAWIPSKKDNTSRGLARDGLALTPESTVRTIVSRLDLGAGAEDLAARVDLDDHDLAFAVEPSPNGDLLFVASQGTNQVDVIDAHDGSLAGGFATGLAPQGLALDSVGRLWVQGFLSRTLSVHDVSELLAGTGTAARELAEIETVGVEPLAPDVLRGKQIFYNADTRRLNQDGYIACASCHLDGGQDGRVWDFTDRGEGLRNTITLRGRAGTGHGPVHWTGNFDEIQDFENDVRFHFGGTGLMADEDFEEGTRSDPLGDPKAGLAPDLDALAAYVASLDEVPPSPHRRPDGSLTDEGLTGRAIFERLDCTDCHGGPERTDSALDVLHDVGTLGPGSGSRRGEPLAGLDTPTLEGVWATAPYLHDGSAPTLRDVIDEPRHGNASGLSLGEKDALVAYLLQLDDTGSPRRLEAERGAWSGGIRFGLIPAGFEGEGYADYPAGGGGRVTWRVPPGRAGAHAVTARHAPGLLPRRLAVRVDGVPAGTLVFPGSVDLLAWTASAVGSIVLPARGGTIELVATDGPGPNLDWIELRPPPDGPAEVACGMGADVPVLLGLVLLGRRARRRGERGRVAFPRQGS